jgi:hypothetical protein
MGKSMAEVNKILIEATVPFLATSLISPNILGYILLAVAGALATSHVNVAFAKGETELSLRGAVKLICYFILFSITLPFAIIKAVIQRALR